MSYFGKSFDPVWDTPDSHGEMSAPYRLRRPSNSSTAIKKEQQHGPPLYEPTRLEMNGMDRVDLFDTYQAPWNPCNPYTARKFKDVFEAPATMGQFAQQFDELIETSHAHLDLMLSSFLTVNVSTESVVEGGNNRLRPDPITIIAKLKSDNGDEAIQRNSGIEINRNAFAMGTGDLLGIHNSDDIESKFRTMMQMVTGEKEEGHNEYLFDPLREINLMEEDRSANPEHQQLSDNGWLEEIISVVQKTDSGYLSASRNGSWGENKNTLMVSPGQGVSNPQIQPEDNFLDTITVYSDATIISSQQKDSYVRELADELQNQFDNIIESHDDDVRDRVATLLPELLKEFSLRIGHRAELNKHREVMFFVHKHRDEIAAKFRDLTETRNKNADDNDSEGSSDLLRGHKIEQELEVRQEIVGDWLLQQDVYSLEGLRKDTNNKGSELADEEYTIDPEAVKNMANSEGDGARSQHDSEEAHSEEQGEDDSGESEAGNHDNQKTGSTYSNVIHDTPAYQWLLSRLRREIMGVTDSTLSQEVRGIILSTLPPAHISKRQPSQMLTAGFELDWDVLAFLEQQKYEIEPHEAVRQVITLTGTCPHVQALSCEEYMRQMWQTTADSILEAVQKAIISNFDTPGSASWNNVMLADGTLLETRIYGTKFLIRVSGVSYSVIEVAEQFAWLGAALRASVEPNTISHCQPHTSVNNGIFQIGFVIRDIRRESPWSTAGQCWHSLFQNPVIAQGFPIHQRAGIESPGLEMPLNIMAALVGTDSVDWFNGKPFLKGYSAMLFATARQDDMILWHLVCSFDGHRISYLDVPAAYLESVSRADLESHRHIVGWCSSARFLAGSHIANYAIHRSALPRPDIRSCLQDISVSATRDTIKGSRFLRGTKERPNHIVADGFIPSLKRIEQQLFLLWDEDDKRGWIVNGTTALLHLVRSSLEKNMTDSASSAFLLERGAIREATNMFQPFSAMGVLVDKENLQLPLYENDDGTYVEFRSRVKHYASILEKLIDMQPEVSTREENAFRDANKLGGWDFATLSVESKDVSFLHVATLNENAGAWLNFLRRTHTVSLFGRGLGELIQPLGEESVCTHWSSLPKHKYYVAMGVSDLKPVIERAHKINTEQLHLTDDLIWDLPPARSGEDCENSSFLSLAGNSEPCSPSQSFLSHILAGYLEGHDWAPAPFDYSAIVFGYHLDFTKTPVVFRSEGRRLVESVSSISEFYHSTTRYTTDTVVTEPNQSYQYTPRVPTSLPFPKPSKWRQKLSIGIICALPKELLAMRLVFDEELEEASDIQDASYRRGDRNSYSFGRIGSHAVVAACLPAGEYGTNAAAAVASDMSRSFELRFCLLVGIGAGVPGGKRDIRLGDVVVSSPKGTCPGVVQYDLAKAEHGELYTTGSLQRPPRDLLSAISSLQSDPRPTGEMLKGYLAQIGQAKSEYRNPGDSSSTDAEGQRIRDKRWRPVPAVHYGPIASGNLVVKDATLRDKLAEKHGILCFEMEAAGIMNTCDCLVIRGICDFADKNKDDAWQEYAAAAAASYAKLLLSVLRPAGSDHEHQHPAQRLPEPIPTKPKISKRNRLKSFFQSLAKQANKKRAVG